MIFDCKWKIAKLVKLRCRIDNEMLDLIKVVPKNLNLKKLLLEWQVHFDEQLDAFVWKETNMKKIVSVGIKSAWIGEDWNMATDNGNSDRNAMLGCDRKLGWKIDLYF